MTIREEAFAGLPLSCPVIDAHTHIGPYHMSGWHQKYDRVDTGLVLEDLTRLGIDCIVTAPHVMVQERMAEAKAALKDACPDGFAVKYFFELEILGTEEAVDVDFEPIAHNTIVFKQYVNGAWVELESSVGDNGVITVCGLLNGPVATFVK